MKRKDDRKVGQIFQAALKLVVSKGLSGITMGDISKAAGIATGTLYVYFKSKDELINALFAACRENSVAHSFKGYDPAQPYKVGFKHVWLNILRYRLHNFEEAVFMEQCYHSPFITPETREKASRLAAPYNELLERGKKEQLLKPVDTGLLITFLVGSMNELVKQTHYHGTTLTRTRINTTFDMCWDALKS
ncbi:transcriptional regulator, TetR family [Chitinophaga terrae (ex Kim and Jung 2007)]|uniref:Transcriptional regulator, TetR family n=1 Tax=Chitinophaga terrae (ex Kim and Jung 2007) TaxID=408074 RepID=A0A1H4FJ68_9BACT|nr:TetR/AcrR family transcriptional regulator [Chitinophaga terrae (ex Kim and Jung 2007)]MDQ0105848.1 AcrR family transcriptional regulator [Chitinophaga terrae (ex Kim and Jung 2007)]GEP92490.1 TetR family transcriptional regulator [Chitinophaga terrae (ex Kim and Jung 2007)]SEA97191.1 transcriptional regulator, TetR family [Chitinophaga terrae (ex Kim and Jung 2007)]